MKRAFLIVLTILVSFGMALAQSNVEVEGPAFAQINAIDELKSEITLSDGNAEVAFKLDLPANGKNNAPSFRLSDLTIGNWISFRWIVEEKKVGKQKTTVRTVVSLRVLGSDAYSILRERLGLDASAKVERRSDAPLPALSPVKLYLNFEQESHRKELLKWAERWNEKQAAKHVAVELVDTPGRAEVALVAYRIDPEAVPSKGQRNLVDSHGLPVYVSGIDFGDFLRTRPVYAVFLTQPSREGAVVLSYRMLKSVQGRLFGNVAKELEDRLMTLQAPVK